MRRARPILLASLTLLSCKRADDAQGTAPSGQPGDGAEIKVGGWYRATLQGRGVEPIPFFLSLPANHAEAEAVVMNGKQWFPAEHRWRGREVELVFSLYHTHVTAEQDAAGALSGDFESESPSFGAASLVLAGTRIDAPDPEIRFEPGSPPAGDVSGAYRLRFEDSGDAKLLLDREGETAFGGTLLFANGNSIYLSGNLRGTRLSLSAFDGTSPYLLTVELKDDLATGEGAWTAGQNLGWVESFDMEKRGAFELKPTYRPKKRRLRIPELAAERYEKKPVVVELAGSWCAHCRNASSFLIEMYERYHGEGLEMLTINLELTEDAEYNRAQAKRMKEAYEIPWEVTARDGALNRFWEIAPELKGDEIPELPVLIMLDRARRVRAMHAGFVGPESGAPHEAQRKKLEQAIEALLKP